MSSLLKGFPRAEIIFSRSITNHFTSHHWGGSAWKKGYMQSVNIPFFVILPLVFDVFFMLQFLGIYVNSKHVHLQVFKPAVGTLTQIVPSQNDVRLLGRLACCVECGQHFTSLASRVITSSHPRFPRSFLAYSLCTATTRGSSLLEE